MQEQISRNKKYLLTLFLLLGMWSSYFEVRVLWATEQAWNKLLTPSGWLAIGVAAFLMVAVLLTLFLSLWTPERIQTAAKSWSALRWLAAVGIFGLPAWLFLFSPWQLTFGPWTQFLIAAGLARLLAWLFDPEQGQPFGWNELALAFSLFLYPRLVQEVRLYYPISFATRGSMAAGLLFLVGLLGFLYTTWGERLRVGLLGLRARLNGYRMVLAGLFLLAPFFLRYIIGPADYILHYNFRFAVFLIALWAAAFLLCTESGRMVRLDSVGVSLGWLVLISAVTRSLLLVVDQPFSLSWSEGNRLYDYSLVFGQSLYNYVGKIPDLYNTPGRYTLWGVLFLWQGLPIWVHRLWNVVILTLPSFVLGWALTRKMPKGFLRDAAFLWITAFFIILAPLQPPFMIAAVIVALFAFHPSPYVRGAAIMAASLYVGLSRWTWVFAPGAWAALIDLLLYYPKREGNWFKRLLPAALMAFLGIVPGFLLSINNFVGYSTGATDTANQPLLWYRLLPNATLGPGILLLMLMYTGPLLALVIYQMGSRSWKLDTWQLLAVWGALIAFLGVGLVISTKIGGGGDLHNLDMYIGTLVFVAAFGLFVSPPKFSSWPVWALALVCLMAFLPLRPFTPFHPGAGYNQRLDLPSHDDMDSALNEIRNKVDSASQRGEVLFMDQRQLLTFGYVNAIPFVPEYEKKYMMDQAMASNAGYFKDYYRDLAAKRFTLIVTEPLKVGLKAESGVFSDENDLWVIWVSMPTLCFYEPVMDDRDVGVSLLVPRENPVGCEQYLK